MAKRDHDTELWDEDWFLDLNDSEMLFWFYLKDRCNHAGFWRPNFKRFEQITGRRINQVDFLKKINSDSVRVVVLENGRWFLAKFISFQFKGWLNLNNPFCRSVYKTFRENISDENTSIYGFEVSETSPRPLKERVRVREKESFNPLTEKSKDEEKATSGAVGPAGDDGARQNAEHRRAGPRAFVPPVVEEVVAYFRLKGYTEASARRAFEYYEVNGWHDGQGRKVLSWKQKMIANWMKPENQDPAKKESSYERFLREKEEKKREAANVAG